MTSFSQGAPARRLDGTVCVVTGAARGIGLAIAERFAREGGRIACVDASERRLGPAVEGLVATGAEARGYLVDVGRRDEVLAAFERIEREFAAPVGVVVNNAVHARFQPLDEVDEETVRRMLAVGLEALIWTTQAAAVQMRKLGRGAIVNLSSTAAQQSVQHATVYAALKAGVLGFTRAAAVELAPHSIRVNAIVPGMIGTPASLGQFDEQTLAERRARMPLGRFGEPAEIASVAAFLASADSAYINGAAIVVDGGWTVSAI